MADEQQQEPGQPTEEEIRAQLEEQIKEVRVQDVLLQSIASLLNLSARRIAKEDERDLEQAKLGINAVEAVAGLLGEKDAEAVRNALSELKMLYAKHSGDASGGPTEEAPEQGAAEAEAPAAKPEPPKRDAGSGLWTPPGT
jgi:hypothetical protein